MRSSLAPNLVSALLSWYAASRRNLPWRTRSDPYGILVSEIMLQQTTVSAVIPYFERWMKVYPTVKDLSEAEPESVLRSWEGLGYYSRARNLHEAARQIVQDYGGRVPGSPEELRRLPGVGDYTASAVASIAFGARTPALDANNLRVWSRLLATSHRKEIEKVFRRVLPRDRPGDFNQALMDLGSAVCVAGDPLCALCPLELWCRARRTGRVREFPPKKERDVTRRIEAAVAVILERGKVLVQKRPDEGLMAGLWEFPGGKLETRPPGDGEGDGADKALVGVPGRQDGVQSLPESPEEAVVREVMEETGLRVEVRGKLGVFTHAYTRFRVRLHVFFCRREGGTLTNPSARWVSLQELDGLAMPSVNRRIVKRIEEQLRTAPGE